MKSIISAMMLFSYLLITCCVIAHSPSISSAEDNILVSFPSKSPADLTALMSKPSDIPEIELKGSLKLPKNVTDKVPAVVFLHGSGGLRKSYWYYADKLVERGMAVLLVDSFGSRGVNNTNIDKTVTLVTYGTMVGDAFGALKFLAAHPAIDPSRIALMGFSKGGAVALYCADKKTSRLLAPDNVSFAGLIAVYPLCMTTFKNLEPTKAPLFIPIGELDDWTPAHWCQKYTDRMKAAGADVKLILYPGAYHAFIFPIPEPSRIPKVINPSNCFNEILDNGRLTVPNEKITLSEIEWRASYVPSCRTLGATLGGGTPELREKFFQDVIKFLAAVLKL